MRMTHIQAVLLRIRLAGVGMEVACWRDLHLLLQGHPGHISLNAQNRR